MEMRSHRCYPQRDTQGIRSICSRNVFTRPELRAFHERTVVAVTDTGRSDSDHGGRSSDDTRPADRGQGWETETSESWRPTPWPHDVPRWNDEYLDRAAIRLCRHYDLERDFRVEGERFVMYGELSIRHERHVMHPSITFAHHEAEEHLFVTEIDRPRVRDLERLTTLGDMLADEWVDADEDHYSTDFSFVVIAEDLPKDVREYVSTYSNRTLLKFGYYGHVEINLVVVVPATEESVASESADLEQAFRVWEPIVKEEPGRLDRLLGWFSR